MNFRDSSLISIVPRTNLVPTLCVGMHARTLCVLCAGPPDLDDAERRGRHSHAERGNEATDTFHLIRFLVGFVGAIVLMVACLVAFAWIGGYLVPWTPLNSTYNDIDIQSGRLRYSRYLLGIRTSERISETWLSKALGQPLGDPEWRHVNTFSPGVRHSPHHDYHGALNQIRYLEISDELVPFDDAAKLQVALRVLQAWQRGSYFEAQEDVDRVSQIAISRCDRGASSLTVADLPWGDRPAQPDPDPARPGRQGQAPHVGLADIETGAGGSARDVDLNSRGRR